MTNSSASSYSLKRRIQFLATAAILVAAVALTVGSWTIDYYLNHDKVLATRIIAEKAVLDLLSTDTESDLAKEHIATLEEIAEKNPQFWYYGEKSERVLQSGPGTPRYRSMLRGSGGGLALPEQTIECPFYPNYFFADEVEPPLRAVRSMDCGEQSYYVEVDGIERAAGTVGIWDRFLSVQSQIGGQTRRNILPTIVLSLLLLGAVTFVFGSLTTRIREVSNEASRIGVENHNIKLPEEDLPKEIVPLVRAINSAIGRLEEAREKQGLFLAAAAHELRTPLAVQRTKLEQLPESKLKIELDENIERMASMIRRLLELAKLDDGKENFESLTLGKLAEDVCVSRGSVALDKGIDLAFDVLGTPTNIAGDSEAVQSAIANLVDNATMFAGDSGTVSVQVEGTEVTVSDSGPGVPDEKQEQIFEPFYKNPPNKRGHGLGLAIVAEIMRMHGGSVSVSNRERGGAVFVLRFPIVQQT